MKKQNVLFLLVYLVTFLFLIFTGCKKDKEDETTDPTPRQIVVSTSAISNLSSSSATCGGNITDDGGAMITERGVCWSTAPNPTITDSITSDGTGSGVFVSQLFGLPQQTLIYVRAYAKNSNGIGYGNTVTFTTQDVIGSAPSISFSNYPSGAYEIDFASLGVNYYDLSFTVSITAEEEIMTFTAKRSVGGTTTNIFPSPTNFYGQTSFTYDYLGSFNESDTYPVYLIFTVTDKQDQATQRSFVVTKHQTTANPINTFTGISLTSVYSAPTAAEYVNVLTGVTYNHAISGSNNATFGFISGGATNGATLFTKGNDMTISSVPSAWANQSYLAATALTESEFNAITDVAGLMAALPTEINYTKVNILQDGAANAVVSVIAFMDGSGKFGLIKLPASITNDPNQVISISIKVQQ